jgi:hypothetical protein
MLIAAQASLDAELENYFTKGGAKEEAPAEEKVQEAAPATTTA